MAPPRVVWFGEELPENVLKKALVATEECDIFLVIGTSSVVYPAAGLSKLAADKGASVVEINIEPTPATSIADFSLIGKSGEILPTII